MKKGKANSRWEFQMAREKARTSSFTLSTYYQDNPGHATINIVTPAGQVLSTLAAGASGPAFTFTAKYRYPMAITKKTIGEAGT